MLATVMLLKLIDATLGLRVGIDEELLVPPRPPPLLSSPLPSPQHPMLALSVPVHAAFTGLGNDANDVCLLCHMLAIRHGARGGGEEGARKGMCGCCMIHEWMSGLAH